MHLSNSGLMMTKFSRRTLSPPRFGRRTFRSGPAERPTEKARAAESPELLEEAKLAAILAYVPFLCIIALTRHRANKWAFSHGIQGLILTTVECLVLVSFYFSKVILLLCVIMALIGVILASQDREFRIPYLGDWIERL